MARIVNRSELAEAFGVALSTVDQWVQQGMPCVARPERRGGTGYKIDLGQVLEWHRDRERSNALGEMAKVDAAEAKRRKTAAEASLAELELSRRRGEVAAIDEVEAAWSAMVAAARARLLGAGPKLGPILASETDPFTCQNAIDGAIHEALAELSTSGGIMGAASPPDGEPVGRPEKKTQPRSKR